MSAQIYNQQAQEQSFQRQQEQQQMYQQQQRQFDPNNIPQQQNLTQQHMIPGVPLEQNQQIGGQNQNEEVEEENLVGVVKIKDGLFICDEYGAQDLEFVISNKVQRIVNTAGMQLTNHWDSIGVQYLTLNWQDDEKQILFDEGEKIPDEVFNFINEALENHDSVLVKSEKAQNRACFVIAAFIMRKYRWSMLKTLEFLNSRRQDLEMRPSFLKQLQVYENKLFKRGLGPKTQRWSEVFENSDQIKNEELILRNTYLNSKQGPWTDYSKNLQQKKSQLLRWRDTVPKQNLPSAIGFVGAAQALLGQQPVSNHTITFDYPKDSDLLQKKVITKQQNHYIYNRDTIQMRQNIQPILKQKIPISTIEHNKENIVSDTAKQLRPQIQSTDQQQSQRMMMQNVTKQKTNVPKINTQDQITMKSTLDNEEPPAVQKLNTHPAHPSSAKNQHQPNSQLNNFMNTSKSGTDKISQPHPRSSSTRVKPIQSSQSFPQTRQGGHTNSLQRDLDTQKLSKLQSQNISQPKRREPTSRVAPKNQLSNSQQHPPNMDCSVLSTNISINQGNSSMVQQSNNSLIQNKQNSTSSAKGGSAATAASSSGSNKQQAKSVSGQHYPSKKQQLRYQQQMNGRGYSPSYNQQMSKDQPQVSSYNNSIKGRTGSDTKTKSTKDRTGMSSSYSGSQSTSKKPSSSNQYSNHGRPGSAPKQSHGHVGSINTKSSQSNQAITASRYHHGQNYQSDSHQRPGSSKNSLQPKNSASKGGSNNMSTPTQMINSNKPSFQSGIVHNHMLSNNHSMVIRNSNSSSNLNQGRTNNTHTNIKNSGDGNNSKSVLSSFRNGPVKILNGANSSGQIGTRASSGQNVSQTQGHYQRQVGSMQQQQMMYGGRQQPIHSSQQPNSSQISANGGHHGVSNGSRPGSAPINNTKNRPASPGNSNLQAQSQNRVKYNKNMVSGQTQQSAHAAAQRATGGIMSSSGSGRGSQRERVDIHSQQPHQFGPGINSKQQPIRSHNYGQSRTAGQKVQSSQVQPVQRQNFSH